MPQKTDLDHFMQLRLSKATVGEIDGMIAKTPELAGFNRCRFVRYAVGFALASLSGESGKDFNRERKS